MTSPNTLDSALLLEILQAAAPAAAIEKITQQHGVKTRRGIYSLVVVVWLMIYQRLNSKRTLSSAVHFLVKHAALWRDQQHACKRIREGRISVRTGGYSQARRKMSTLVGCSVCDLSFAELEVRMRQRMPDVSQPIFVVDGTTLQLPHNRELLKAYPPGSNQHGKNHWAIMLLVAFHDVHTGLAARPSWGPMYGPKAVGAQQLAAEALDRLPEEAVVMGDGDFGIFAFAYSVQQTGRSLLLRLTVARAHKVLGGFSLRPGRKRKVVWETSAWDRQHHPDLPPKAMVKGWIVACPHPARKGELLYFFTTLDQKPKRILALYKLRWNIETDLRSLKRTVGLYQMASKSKAMVENEILMAIAAYNVVRAVMYLAASAAALTPRQLSFSSSQDAVMVAWPYLQCAHTPAEFQHELESLLAVVVQTKLPTRSGRRAYPREIWGHGAKFPSRQSSQRKARR
jgi:putative transposase